jgi:L-asparagine oxygenase
MGAVINSKSKSLLRLQEDEINVLIELAERITADPSEEPELFCKQCALSSADVPNRVRDAMLDFVMKGSDTGYLLFQRIPLDEFKVENTPETNGFKIGEKTILAKIQAILINIIGEMIAYEAEGDGRLFQDIVPSKKMAKDQTSLGSNTELEIHTEQAFSNLKPDILSLSCLRGDPGALTYILPVQKIINNLSEEDTALLYLPLWKTGVDMSFKLNGHEFIEGDVRGPLPILQGNKIDPILTFDQDLMSGVDETSESMIGKIVNVYYSQRLSHNLTPGEIIFIDNRRAVHGRSPFFPKYDGADRFLVRCFAVFDYEKSKHARLHGGRMVSAIYS